MGDTIMFLGIEWTKETLGFGLVTLANAAIVFFVALNLGGMLTWVERKQGAVMANRIGADRAYIPIPRLKKGKDGSRWNLNFTLMGVFHALADGGKMILKEDFRPPFTDKVIYALAPWFAVVPAFLVFCVMPFGGAFQPGHTFSGAAESWLADNVGIVGALRDWMVDVFGDRVMHMVVADLDMGVLFVFAVGSTGVFAAALAGWSSNNKFSMLGALRASAQMISYEVFVGISVIGLFLLHGSVNLVEIVDSQHKVLWWGAIMQFPMMFIFLTGLIAENKRVPFDMPESESELVAGYMTEYSGMKMGLFMMSEFVEVAVIGCLVTALFLGGPFLPGMTFTQVEWAGMSYPVLTGFLGLSLSPLVAVLLQFTVFWSKVIFMAWFQVLIRWTVPKFRYDQVMYLGWKIMLPLCIVNLFVIAAITGVWSEWGASWPEWSKPVAAGAASIIAFGVAIAMGTSGWFGTYQRTQAQADAAEANAAGEEPMNVPGEAA